MSIKSLVKVTVGGALMMVLTGCTALWTHDAYPVGSLYSGIQVPSANNRNELSGAAKSGDKHGEACATGILGAVAFGDASVDAAKKAGGITEVHSVENHFMTILGIYTQGCTEIHGK